MSLPGPANATVVERVGAALVVRAMGTNGSLGEVATAALAEPNRVPVVVDPSASGALHTLDRRLLAQLAEQLSTCDGRGQPGMRLLAGGTGRPAPDGGPALADRLAERLGVEVVAPSGELLVLRGGELFTAGLCAGWLRFRRGLPPDRAGPRFPAPAWQPALPEQPFRSRRFMVVPTPAGLWVRAARSVPATLQDLGFGVPPDPERLTVLVGAPAEPPPDPDDLAEVLGQLPPALRRSLVLTPYGPQPAGAVPLAQMLADRLGAPVDCRHGLPYYGADRRQWLAMVDASGRPTWQPVLRESRYLPGLRAPAPREWASPSAEFPVAGPAGWWLDREWVVEAIPCGLLVRPASHPEAIAGRAPVDPDHVTLVLATGPAAQEFPSSTLAALQRLTRSLPDGARDRLRVVPSPATDPALAGQVAQAVRASLHLPARAAVDPARTVAIPTATAIPPAAPAPPPPVAVGRPLRAVAEVTVDAGGWIRPAGRAGPRGHRPAGDRSAPPRHEPDPVDRARSGPIAGDPPWASALLAAAGSRR